MKDKLLIHACCGPCLVGVYEDIQNNLEDFNITGMEDVDILWYNPNIHPKKEYIKRRDTLVEYLKMVGKEPIILEEYDLMKFAKVAVNPKDYGFCLRCEYCYRVRLRKLFEYAKENGYTAATTTLLISPYQKHEMMIDICKEYEKEYGVKFVYKDFRTIFRKGQQRARELELYRQKYCGCIFSIDEGA